MNIRILAASALALAILVPAANAATRQPAHSDPASSASDIDHCPNGSMNLGTLECAPFRSKVVHARVVKHVVKPVTAFERMTENMNSYEESGSH